MKLVGEGSSSRGDPEKVNKNRFERKTGKKHLAGMHCRYSGAQDWRSAFFGEGEKKSVRGWLKTRQNNNVVLRPER